jgi:hypothetical protein
VRCVDLTVRCSKPPISWSHRHLQGCLLCGLETACAAWHPLLSSTDALSLPARWCLETQLQLYAVVYTTAKLDSKSNIRGRTSMVSLVPTASAAPHPKVTTPPNSRIKWWSAYVQPSIANCITEHCWNSAPSILLCLGRSSPRRSHRSQQRSHHSRLGQKAVLSSNCSKANCYCLRWFRNIHRKLQMSSESCQNYN